LEEALQEVGLYKLYEEIEMPLVSVLADMEYEGVSIDKVALDELSEDLKIRIAETEKIIYEMAGKEFNISSPKQLGEILFDQMNIDPGNKKTKTGQYSTSEQVLSKLEDAHPIVGHILNYRGLKKLLTTYAEALPTYIDPATGKIHTHFNQAEAATGRLSSLNPNLQNTYPDSRRSEHSESFYHGRSGLWVLLGRLFTGRVKIDGTFKWYAGADQCFLERGRRPCCNGI
jgi:DNA polymerase-1